MAGFGSKCADRFAHFAGVAQEQEYLGTSSLTGPRWPARFLATSPGFKSQKKAALTTKGRMMLFLTGVLALLLLGVTAYAHSQVATFTRGSANILTVRLILIVVGALFGWLGASGYDEPLAQIFRFCIGFGMVHVPAAAVLFIKGQRGAGKS